jgi:hypothetical protein
MMKRLSGLVSLLILAGCQIQADPVKSTQPVKVPIKKEYDVVLTFPMDRYPETGDHIRDAIAAGEWDMGSSGTKMLIRGCL